MQLLILYSMKINSLTHTIQPLIVISVFASLNLANANTKILYQPLQTGP